MKKFVSIFAVIFASAALAFDSEAWLARRAQFDREAERLKSRYADCAAAVKSPAENVSVPIENWPDGTLRSQITAARAQFFIDEGLVWGEGVTVREFTEKGELKTEVTAANCLIERETKSGWVEGAARAKYGKTELMGEGIFFSFSEEFVKISTNVVIRSSDFKLEGVKL